MINLAYSSKFLPNHQHTNNPNDGGPLDRAATLVATIDGPVSPVYLANEIDFRQANINFFNNSRDSRPIRYGQYLAIELVFS